MQSQDFSPAPAPVDIGHGVQQTGDSLAVRFEIILGLDRLAFHLVLLTALELGDDIRCQLLSWLAGHEGSPKLKNRLWFYIKGLSNATHSKQTLIMS